jgi:hypothetical protein
MNIKSILVAAILGAAGGLVGSYWIVKEHQDHLSQSPPIIIVDLAKIASSSPEPLVANTHEAITKLKAAGYLVLDASAVIGAPDDLYLPMDLLSPN